MKSRFNANYTSRVIYPRVCTALIFSLLSSGYSQSTHARVLDRTVIQQQDSPLAFAQWHGSAAVIKNVFHKRIASFVFVCVVRTGKIYKAVDSYDSSEGMVGAGEFSHEGGMDAPSQGLQVSEGPSGCRECEILGRRLLAKHPV